MGVSVGGSGCATKTCQVDTGCTEGRQKETSLAQPQLAYKEGVLPSFVVPRLLSS